MIIIRGPDYASRFIAPIPDHPDGMLQFSYRGQTRYLMPQRLETCVTTQQVAEVFERIQAVVSLGGIGNHELLIVPYVMRTELDKDSDDLMGERFDEWSYLSGAQDDLLNVERHEIVHMLQMVFINAWENMGFWRLVDHPQGAVDDPIWANRPQEQAAEWLKVALFGGALAAGIPVLTPQQMDLVRMFAQAQFGGQAKAEVVILESDRFTLSLQIDNPVADINGCPLVMDSPPTIVKSRTLGPLRFIAETLGALIAAEYYTRVEWDEATRTAQVVIIRK